MTGVVVDRAARRRDARALTYTRRQRHRPGPGRAFSRKRGVGLSKHARVFIINAGKPTEWKVLLHSTGRRPWTVKAENRAARQVRRAARKANRP